MRRAQILTSILRHTETQVVVQGHGVPFPGAVRVCPWAPCNAGILHLGQQDGKAKATEREAHQPPSRTHGARTLRRRARACGRATPLCLFGALPCLLHAPVDVGRGGPRHAGLVEPILLVVPADDELCLLHELVGTRAHHGALVPLAAHFKLVLEVRNVDLLPEDLLEWDLLLAVGGKKRRLLLSKSIFEILLKRRVFPARALVLHAGSHANHTYGRKAL
eukprot:901591-Pyramimonas_sp.AAC.2